MRNIFPHLLFSLLFFPFNNLFIEKDKSQNTTIPVNVGVVLDMDEWIGKMGFSCISMALSDFYASHENYKTRLVLHPRDSRNDVVGAAAAALDLIKNVQVQAIIGPVTSMQTDFVIDLGDKANVPICTFSAKSPSLSSSRSQYFFRAALNDSSQVKAISAIIKAFGWREVVAIYVDNEYGEGVIPYLNDALQEVDACIPYRSVIPPSATDDQIEEELYKLMTMQTRIFIVHMLPSLGSRIFEKAEEIGMMSEDYVWIVTDGIGNTLSSINSSVITDSMQGVLGVKAHFAKTKVLEEFRVRWKRKFQHDNPDILDAELNIFGLWAYDATFALAMAIERINATDFSFFKKTNISSNNTDLDTIGTSQTGSKLRQELSNTRFKGLTGDFYLVDGQLQSSAFQLVNVIGNGVKGIGFWTAMNGISKKVKSTTTSPYSTSKDNLGTIFWPGETTSVPRGWTIPAKGKRLKIGVPVKDGFSEFVKVNRDLSTGDTKLVSGYCIDVFKAVIEVMPYAVPHDLVPFAYPNGTSLGSYNDLIYQVYLQNYDAVVGDTTIVANRSLYVDFTLPFTESGVSMVVPIKGNNHKNPWVFLKPLTLNLWITIGGSFVFIGFVIWFLEHRINEDFRGPPSQQASMILWFSFSTMVFAYREKVLSNLARFVTIVWVFVVLILTQSYTASLTSMLTVQNLKPTFTDINELIKGGEYVGYQKGSFVIEFLKKLGFDKSKLREYSSPEECDEAFSKGSARGGIAAAFDETPYMRLFLGKYCSKYTMVGPVYKTGGFGFVFPKGSPLVPDISRAVLNVTETEKIMVPIEKAWLGTQTSCPDTSSSASDTSNSLGVDSFWGLFLIVVVASGSAFLINAAIFLYEHKHVLNRWDPDSSVWHNVRFIFMHFDDRDLNSYNFRRSEMNRIDPMLIEASPDANLPRRSSVSSTHTDANVVTFGEQGTPSAESSEPNPNRQTPQGRVLPVELTNIPNDDRQGAPEITHESN